MITCEQNFISPVIISNYWKDFVGHRTCFRQWAKDGCYMQPCMYLLTTSHCYRSFWAATFCEVKCYVKIWCSWLVGPHLRSQLGITYQSHRPWTWFLPTANWSWLFNCASSWRGLLQLSSLSSLNFTKWNG